MRIRTIKPEFFLHSDLFDAEEAEGLPLRLAFIGLWCAADREGRFKWEPRRLKAQVMPYDSCDFSRVLHALTTRGFIVHYASNGAEFGAIQSFSRHQIINNRESASVLPKYDDTCELMTRASRVNHACPTPLNLDQGEGKGREGNSNTPIVPLEGTAGSLIPEPKDHSEKASVKTPLQLRAEKLLRKRPTTPWDRSELRAYASAKSVIEATTEDDWTALERFYALPQSESYARKTLATLLNNWGGEIDRARNHQAPGFTPARINIVSTPTE